LVGVPNAGKSTLLASVTAARPKIAPYPFTTLQPNLGVVVLGGPSAGRQSEFVLADIPGLIEGAAEGKGLGHEFLRHVERTRILVHLLDGLAVDPLADFAAVNRELSAFGHGLAQKPQLVALNKSDMPEVQERWPEIEAKLKAQNCRAMLISALTGEGTRQLLNDVAQMLANLPKEQADEALPVLRMAEDQDSFAIRQDVDGWRVQGVRIERLAAKTVWNLDEAVRRFQQTLERTGIVAALEDAGVQPGDTVRIGERELVWEE
jgi:GTP-binding protein